MRSARHRVVLGGRHVLARIVEAEGDAVALNDGEWIAALDQLFVIFAARLAAVCFGSAGSAVLWIVGKARRGRVGVQLRRARVTRERDMVRRRGVGVRGSHLEYV